MPETHIDASKTRKPADLAKVQVLLIEDDFHTREMVRRVLKQIGVGQIHLAENGREAVTVLQAAQGVIDMAFLDLDMPAMGGFTCLQIIRAAPKESIANLPVVILTAYAGFRQLEKAADLGISGFLSKLISVKTLAEALTKSLNGETVKHGFVAGLK